MAAAEERLLRISDFSDREILGVITDAGGTVTAQELAIRIFKPEDGDVPHFTRCVTSRLVWMRRYGLIERESEGPGWLISNYGQALRTGRVSDSVAGGIDRMSEDSMLNLGHIVGLRLVGIGEVSGRAMQRELVHQINRRKARLRGW